MFVDPSYHSLRPGALTATRLSWVWRYWHLRAYSWSGPRMVSVPTRSERSCW